MESKEKRMKNEVAQDRIAHELWNYKSAMKEEAKNYKVKNSLKGPYYEGNGGKKVRTTRSCMQLIFV